MKFIYRRLAGVAALCAAAGMAATSFAQEPPPAGMTGHAEWAAKTHERMHERAEARAKRLHDILAIAPDQEAAFQAFIASMRAPEGHRPMDGQHDHDATATMTTPERLYKMAARMAEHQAAFQRRADATRRFYAALNPGQQRAFDALHDMTGHHGHGGHGWGGRGEDSMGEHPQG